MATDSSFQHPRTRDRRWARLTSLVAKELRTTSPCKTQHIPQAEVAGHQSDFRLNITFRTSLTSADCQQNTAIQRDTSQLRKHRRSTQKLGGTTCLHGIVIRSQDWLSDISRLEPRSRRYTEAEHADRRTLDQPATNPAWPRLASQNLHVRTPGEGSQPWQSAASTTSLKATGSKPKA